MDASIDRTSVARRRAFLRATLAVVAAAGLAVGTVAEAAPRAPGPKDKCPVCGMFVAKYPDWLGQIDFRDGSSAFFDGPKDLLRYYFDLPKYAAGRTNSDVTAVFVKDYYSLALIDGRTAFYVIGSNVFGPMGKELIPFAKEAEAKQFYEDHKGKGILTLRAITPDILRALE